VACAAVIGSGVDCAAVVGSGVGATVGISIGVGVAVGLAEQTPGIAFRPGMPQIVAHPAMNRAIRAAMIICSFIG